MSSGSLLKHNLLDEFVYKKIWDGLTEVEKQVVLAIPKDAPIKTGEVCDRAGITTGSLSKYRDRLMKKGIIFSPKHGYIETALPRFSKIINEYPMR